VQLRGMARRLRLQKAGWVLILALIAAPSILHSQFGIGFSPILTGSMRPAGNPGDVFITKRVQASSLRVGDIIAVHNQTTGVFYAHRIIGIRLQNGVVRIVTKGDANPSADHDPFLTSQHAPTSKEIFRILWVGRPLVYLASYQGRHLSFTLLVTSNVLGIIYLLLRRKKVVSDHGMRVYKELYQEERLTNVMYKEALEELGTAKRRSKPPKGHENK
jgi:signal peptidase I